MSSGKARRRILVAWPIALLLAFSLVSSRAVEARALASPPAHVFSLSEPELQTRAKRRVNAPGFDGSVAFSETAILWFGQVTPTLNSADVRIGYNHDHLFVHVAAFDRRLWYDPAPSPGDLTEWDAISLYLDTDGSGGNAPYPNDYRFDGQLVWYEDPRDNWQVAYRGNGSGWAMAGLPFTTISGWQGVSPNCNDGDDRGWVLIFEIPFASLGLGGPPQEGAVWGLGLALHDRDDSAGTFIPDQVWPEAMESQRPATWGELAFGLPAYTPPASSYPGGTITVRQGLNGATVPDADVGGSHVCGDASAPDFFSTWGSLNYAGNDRMNIQNQGNVSDWPCFSKYYVTFPLNQIPPNKVILSATLTLRQFGHTGEGYYPGPQPSFIQVLTIGEGWNEASLTWNNAPLALENVTGTWSEPLENPGWPGEDRNWDVSLLVAEAYAAGLPVRLALYEADWADHSGKYFYTSDRAAWDEENRPTLTIVWGQPSAPLEKSAAPASGSQGDAVTYTLSFVGSGLALSLTDTLPEGVSAPYNFVLEGTGVMPTYDSVHHRLTWGDTAPVGQPVALRYSVTITTGAPRALVNWAELREVGGDSATASTTVIANPHMSYIPLVQH